MSENFINIINTFFSAKIFLKKNLSKIEYLSNFNEKKELIKINALKGDKIIDFYIYEHIVEKIIIPNCEEENKWTKGMYDDVRQNISSDDQLSHFFDSFNIKNEITFNASNDIGKKLKASFVEALYYEIYKISKKSFTLALEKLYFFTEYN